MVARRRTRHIKVFERGGSSAVIYDLSQPHRVTVTVPKGSHWTSGPHWHETHDEYLQIVQGRALVRLGDRIQDYGAKDGIIHVPRHAVHEWRRGPASQLALIVREWTAPEDGQKEGFFRMLNSFLTEPQAATLYEAPVWAPAWTRRWIEQWVVILQLYIIFRAWDNWPVLIGNNSGWVSWMATHLTSLVAAGMGRLLGLHGVYDEYVTPSEQWKEKST